MFSATKSLQIGLSFSRTLSMITLMLAFGNCKINSQLKSDEETDLSLYFVAIPFHVPQSVVISVDEHEPEAVDDNGSSHEHVLRLVDFRGFTRVGGLIR